MRLKSSAGWLVNTVPGMDTVAKVVENVKTLYNSNDYGGVLQYEKIMKD